MHATLEQVEINGEAVEAKENARGFYEITRRWNSGDTIGIDMDYKLELHVQEGEEESQWIAFTYGPLALAQVISEIPEEERFMGLGLSWDEPEKIMELLEESKDEDDYPIFTVADFGITLVPFYRTATWETGPRTYFRLE
jgi:hypothetical protein